MLRTATLCVCMGVLGDADIQVLHRSVAAHHCVIEHHKNGKVYIEDLEYYYTAGSSQTEFAKKAILETANLLSTKISLTCCLKEK